MPESPSRPAATIRQLALPSQIDVGAGASARLPQVLAQRGLANPLIVTDAYLVSSGLVAGLVEALGAAGLRSAVFADTVPDPTTAVVVAAAAAARAGGHDCVVGFGGGSPIDTAKAVALLAVQDGHMRAFKAPRVVTEAALPIIAIPTTAGTGSEATRVCVIIDSETQEKMLILGPAFMPVAALVDYRLTLTMPLRLTADTGLDSLTHAIESYVSRQANPFSDAVALQAMAIITRHIRTACREPENLAAREAMMWGATLGGLAFSNASVALVHGMSRPLGAIFHVPHGLSNAMLLPVVTAFSIPDAPVRYAQVARAMSLATDSDSDEAALAALTSGLENLCADLSVPSPKAYGIEQSRYFGSLETMAQQALDSGSPANNPRVPGVDEIVVLYEKIWA